MLSNWLSLSFGLHIQVKKYAMARNIERRALGIRDWRKSDESSQPPLDDIIQILSKYGKVCKFASSKNLNIYWVRFKLRSTEDNFVDIFSITITSTVLWTILGTNLIIWQFYSVLIIIIKENNSWSISLVTILGTVSWTNLGQFRGQLRGQTWTSLTTLFT